MAIDRIPGVGPQNSDIAAAVNAPSAATIAAAVAAPSAATIATQVAASVPTLSQINTAVANNAPSSFNWIFLGSVSISGVSGSISGIGGYRAYRIIVPSLFNGGSEAYPGVRINGDSSAIYQQYGLGWNASIGGFTTISHGGENLLFFNAVRSTPQNQVVTGIMEIYNASNTSGWKVGVGRFQGSSAYSEYDLIWRSTAAISSFTFVNNAGGNISTAQNIQVWGAN